LSYLANRQTDKQTKSGKNITSLAEVKSALMFCVLFYICASPTRLQWPCFSTFAGQQVRSNLENSGIAQCFYLPSK